MLSSSSALFAYSPPAGKPQALRLCDVIEGRVWYNPITKSTLDLREHLTEAKAKAKAKANAKAQAKAQAKAKAKAEETTTILCIGGQLRGFDGLVIDYL